jgi:MYXO-CTERM domain-containing protein
MKKIVAGAIGLGLTLVAAEQGAHAFCGFYVNGAGSEMFNDATQVVLMRSGTRTVLSMQNDYRGPLEDFAMVVPVPVVLHEGDVKTLPKDVFAKVDVMGAPRLVEYWEQDPCFQPKYEEEDMALGAAGGAVPEPSAAGSGSAAVKIEARFEVGEYQVLILSATQATALETWLTDNHYKIPAGAAALLKPYVANGSKFFVAKVDPKKVKMEDGHAALSPLRFYYDWNDFTLPIRLGLANSPGTQDLIVSILSPGKRYELANYKNVTIPTNINVNDRVKGHFGEFYAALFDKTVEKNPGAIVTEYSWDASSCDPCPGPTLDTSDFATLGADVLAPGGAAAYASGEFVLTRLHARYGKDAAPDDLVFKEAKAIVGGREEMGAGGKLEEGAAEASDNNFQGRYIIRHEWDKPITCANPVRGRWGGPWSDAQIAQGQMSAIGTAFVKRSGAKLPLLVAQDVPEIGVRAAGVAAAVAHDPEGVAPAPATSPRAEEAQEQPSKATGKHGCGCQSTGGGDVGGGLILFAGVAFVMRRRKGGAS